MMKLLILSVLFFSIFHEANSCTTLVVGAKASTTGSPMLTHTNDCLDCDFRINQVPAMDWPEGSTRPLYGAADDYPRIVVKDRGTTWHPDNLEDSPHKAAWAKGREPVGYIPQVAHTYALVEGLYGMMNEFGVAIGESSTGATLIAASVTLGGKALMCSSDLTMIALERAQTAREAVLIMGQLAEQYGYFGAVWEDDSKRTVMTYEESGDTFSVIDKEEAYLFMICPDDTGASAIWVAYRIPEDSFAVVSNRFTLNEVDPTDPNFLYSSNLWDVATRAGLWSPSEGRLLNWKNDIAYPQQVPHHTYATRRQWRLFSLVKPSLYLNPYPSLFSNAYPLYVTPDFKISPEFLFEANRDYFQGTEFDMSKGVGAGPFGTPERFDWWNSHDGSLTFSESGLGYFERPVGMYRTVTGLVATPRKDVPPLLGASFWMCQYNPGASVFLPLFVGVKSLPPAFTTGSLFEYDLKSFFWTGAAVGDHQRYFSMYIRPEVVAEAQKLEKESAEKLVEVEAKVISLLDESKEEKAVRYLTDFVNSNVDAAHKYWQDLHKRMMTRWHDGYVIEVDKPTLSVTKLFYPKEWLKIVGWFEALDEERRRENYFLQFEPDINSVPAQNDLTLLQFPYAEPVHIAGEVATVVSYTPDRPLEIPFYSNETGTLFGTVLGKQITIGSTSSALQFFWFVAAAALFTSIGAIIGFKVALSRHSGYTHLNLQPVQIHPQNNSI